MSGASQGTRAAAGPHQNLHSYSRARTAPTQPRNPTPNTAPAQPRAFPQRGGQEENKVGFRTQQGKLPLGAETASTKATKTLLGQSNTNCMGRPAGGGVERRPSVGARKGPASAGGASAQSSCIRQILLLQLELIEQQQQQLQNKSLEIEELRSEKETLLARMEQMERCLQRGRKEGVEEEEEEYIPRLTEDISHLTTTDMYLCRWHQAPPSPSTEPSPKGEEAVTIPSWRESSMEPLGREEAVDIPENLNDCVFLKRHSKHEQDEKRRKRWDIQRVREQRMFHRLQQRNNRRKGLQDSQPEVLSFYPELENVEALLVTPHLPVVAFGWPLPKLSLRVFHLPWLDGRSRCRVYVPKKQTPHRTCRK
ncbi:male-specific lethal 1-like 1 [Aplochiton taeniatus]